MPVALRGGSGRVHRLGVTVSLAHDVAWVRAMWPDGGPRQFKLKVGVDPDRDVERVRGLREALGPDAVISVDANMAWSPDQAAEMVARLARFDIAWYEEPLARHSFTEYRTLRRGSGARLMLDESVCSSADLRAAIDAQACDLINLKLAKCGGLISSLRLAAIAREGGIGFQLGAMVGETGVLAAAERQFAAMIGELAGYDAPALFRHRLVREDLRVDYTSMTCVDLPGTGLGVTIDRAILDRFSARAVRWEPHGGWIGS